MSVPSNTLSVDEKLSWITRGLQEVLGEETLRTLLAERDRPLRIYWGTAPTGRPHVGYFVPMIKLAHFLRAGCEVTVLFADLHARLDTDKAGTDAQAEARTAYYQAVVRALLASLHVDCTRLRFVVGSEFQLGPAYTRDTYRLAARLTVHDAAKAGTEVVKQAAHPTLAALLYPGLQALDEEHLHVDAQFGGVDQRKIFVLAEKMLPKLGYRKRAHLMNPMVPGLMGSKMSASDPASKLDLLDTDTEVAKKLRRAFCEEGKVEDNGVLAFCASVLFPARELLGHPGLSVVVAAADTPACQADGRTSRMFSDYHALETAYAAREVHPADLKRAVADGLCALLAPIRAACDTDTFRTLAETAYPSGNKPGWSPSPTKSEKKTKKKHTKPTETTGLNAQMEKVQVDDGVVQENGV